MGRPAILSGLICYNCGSDQTSKGGWAKGKRRFKCRDCGKFFIEGGSAKLGTKYLRRNAADLPSKQHLLMELKAIAQELGRAPTTMDWVRLRHEDRVCPLGWFYEVFGSFLKAVKLAGLKPKYLQEFDAKQREKMLDELRKLSRELGRPLFGEDVFEARKKKKVSPINHYQLAFKTVPGAIAAAGVAPKMKYTDEEMIAILRELDVKLGRPVMETDIDELYRAGKAPAGHTLEKRFGGMNKARKAAGIRQYSQKGRKHKPRSFNL